jgi:hypothetical protein
MGAARLISGHPAEMGAKRIRTQDLKHVAATSSPSLQGEHFWSAGLFRRILQRPDACWNFHRPSRPPYRQLTDLKGAFAYNSGHSKSGMNLPC